LTGFFGFFGFFIFLSLHLPAIASRSGEAGGDEAEKAQSRPSAQGREKGTWLPTLAIFKLNFCRY